MSIFSQRVKERWSGISHVIPNGVRLLKINFKEDPRIMVGLTFVVIVSSIVPFVSSAVIATIINQLVATPTDMLLPLVGVLVIVSVLPSFLSSIYSYLNKRNTIKMMNFFELLYAEKQAELDVADLENPKFQDVLNRARENFYANMNMIDSMFDLMRNVVGLILASIILFAFSPLILLVILIGVIPQFWVETKYGTGEWSIWASKSEDRRAFGDLRYRFMNLAELIELKIFQNSKHFLGKMRGLLGDFEDEQIKLENKRFGGNLITFIFSVLTIGFAIFWSVNQVTVGALEIGTMTFVLYSITNFSGSFSAFLLTIAQQLKYSLYVTDIFEIFDRTSNRDALRKKGLLSDRTPEIVFENVSFAYPDTTELVLKDFSLTIKPNERIALVGINGSGKTTLIKLLAGFYSPTKGKILIDGIDLEEIDLMEWYSKIAILFQDYATYHFLVKDGISLGDSSKEQDIEGVKGAAFVSDSDSFISKWKYQYEQMIGKEFSEGVEPSKGQSQKLALARSFYRNPEVLILDEPTASVDAEAEAKIFESLEELPKEKTLILISHRFSTVRNADRICVIEDGRVAELGSHDELINNNKTYKALFEKQAKGYK